MASKITELKKLVGPHFIIGFNGYSVPSDYAQLVQEYHVGGTMYLKRNVQSPAQLAELSNELQFSTRPKEAPPFFISIDHEGGKVNRLVKPFTKFPGVDHLGEINSPKLAFHFGMVLGKELRAVGININYAPVLDVLTNSDSSVIRNRAFSSDPDNCAKMGSAVSRGIQKMGVMAVGKHFPGHGCVKEDSHHKLPKTKRSREALEKVELIPFLRAIRSRIEGIMTAHILNSSLDPDHPCTLSSATIQPILREYLRFTKVVFSDDMEMKAMTAHYDPKEAAVMALNAGCDQLIYRGESGIHHEALEAVVKAIEEKKIKKEWLLASQKRIVAAKKLYASKTKPVEITEVGKSIGLTDHFKLADIITRRERVNESERPIPDIPE